MGNTTTPPPPRFHTPTATGTCCRSEENATATENAVSALGKVIEYQAGVLDAQQGVALADTWVRALPVVEDAVEALQVHAQLVRFIEASDARCAQSTVPMS